MPPFEVNLLRQEIGLEGLLKKCELKQAVAKLGQFGKSALL